MIVYAFTRCLEAGYKSVFRKRGATLRQIESLDMLDLTRHKFKKDALYYLGSDFPVYAKILAILLEREVENIIVELPERSKLQTVIRKSNMAIMPAHGSIMMLETALTSLGLDAMKKTRDRIVWGSNPSMMRIRELLPKISSTDISIHITGEVGSGKNTIADEIARRRGLNKTVYINCASLSTELADDMLFGHAKGAFTSASDSRNGLCAEADGGILFLDELQDLPNEAQAKLLHLLETGKFRQNGTNREMKSCFKIITSSSLPFESLKGHLRPDFMSRIGTINLEVPPLRERNEDIPELISHIRDVRNFNNGPDDEEIERMRSYSWPGNIRELNKALEYYNHMDELPPGI